MTDHEHHEVHQRHRTVDRRVFSPAQVVAGIIGMILVIIGGVVLARVGLDSLTGDTTAVFGFEHTALMGLIDVIAGLFFLGAAAGMLNAYRHIRRLSNVPEERSKDR